MWKCRNIWHTRIGNKKVSLKTTSKRQAVSIEAKLKVQFLNNIHGIKKVTNVTFSELMTHYLENLSDTRNNTKTFIRKKNDFKSRINKHLISHFENRPIFSMNTSELYDWANNLCDATSPGTANRIIASVRSLIKYGLTPKSDKYYELVSDPADIWPSFKERSVGVSLDKDEISCLLKSEDKEFLKIKNLVVVALHTGLRQANLIGLRWDWINFNDNTINIPANETKANTNHSLPILPHVRSILANVKGDNSEFVFTHKGSPWAFGSSVTRIWNECQGRVGVKKKVRFHDLRHTCGTLLLESGKRLEVVQKYLGHKDQKTTEKYVHVTDFFIKNGLSDWNIEGLEN